VDREKELLAKHQEKVIMISIDDNMSGSAFNTSAPGPLQGLSSGLASVKTNSITTTQGLSVNRNFKDWIAEGDVMYQNAMGEYRELESQIEELERKLILKRDEVNEIARVVGKEALDGGKKLSAEIVDRGHVNSVPNSANTIARAITGRINR